MTIYSMHCSALASRLAQQLVFAQVRDHCTQSHHSSAKSDCPSPVDGTGVSWRNLVTALRRQEHEAQGVHAVPLVCGVTEGLTPEHVPHVTVTSGAEDLAPPTICITLLIHCILHVCPKSWPATAAVELHAARVQRHLEASCQTACACVDSFGLVIIEALWKCQLATRLCCLLPKNLVHVLWQLGLPLRVWKLHVHRPCGKEVSGALLRRLLICGRISVCSHGGAQSAKVKWSMEIL
mmetsp:Transcript_30037/g.48170  ORF Transcript_30037/g.48170 Transcript_30037/m.48170 type:complete len:237 (+) Transcript_30037:90-800(+)